MTDLTRGLAMAVLLTLTLPALPAWAEDRRGLDAHVHGHGTLNIAIDGQRIAFELDAPGMDIVGFEHAASTPDQTAAVDKAKALLADPLALFQLPASGRCQVSEAKVAAGGAEADGDAKEADHDAEHAAEHSGHSGYEATYLIDCAAVAEVTSIRFGYFEAFAGAQSLSVTVISDRGQSTHEVVRATPTLYLGASP